MNLIGSHSHSFTGGSTLRDPPYLSGKEVFWGGRTVHDVKMVIVVGSLCITELDPNP